MKTQRIIGLSVAAVALVLATVTPTVAAKIEGADQGGRPLSAVLSGANEVPPGDADGTGWASVTVNVGQGTICYEVSVINVEPVIAAHIHRAPEGSNGPVVVPLSVEEDGTFAGCVDVDRALAREILQNPGAFYVNVHTQTYPGGAVRGQLSK